jgi:hypothetical protein
MMNWEGRGRKQLRPNFKALSQHLPGETEENHENVSHNSRSCDLELSLGPPEYEAGVFTN